MTACLSMLFIGLFAVLSYSTELVSQQVNGDYEYVFTSSNAIPIGAQPQTEACAQALAAQEGECTLWVGGVGSGVRLTGGPGDARLERLNRVIESDWAGSSAKEGFQLTDGRWPTAFGEVVVGPDFESAEQITAWGGRIHLTVVGRAREAGWRHGEFVLLAPGTFASWSNLDMELSGVGPRFDCASTRRAMPPSKLG